MLNSHQGDVYTLVLFHFDSGGSMANARHQIWHRAGPWTAITTSVALAVLAAPGCDDGNGTGTTGGGGTGTSSTTTSTTGGTGGTGATGGSTGGGGQALTPELTPAGTTQSPLDSTPDSTGTNFYFVGHKAGIPGVFKVGANGGAVSDIFIGDPLAGPVGISIATDDSSLYVADVSYDNTADDPDSPRGVLMKMGTTVDSTPSPIASTAGYRPRGLDVTETTEGDVITFTGVDPSNGQPGLYSVLASGGGVTKIATGSPFVDPSGVVVTKDKTFVTDVLATDTRFASVIVVENGVASEFVKSLGVGYPAGISVTSDEKLLLVSGIDPLTGTDVIHTINVATKEVSSFTNAVLEKNLDAGGLHRARKADVYSWCDLTTGDTGLVYKVVLK
ncbi:MAG: hypothetical protein IPK82_09900 [Polyangiaceae bacterium]|nr:hypothetical protein [Polyangiaceae bacterium]